MKIKYIYIVDFIDEKNENFLVTIWIDSPKLKSIPCHIHFQNLFEIIEKTDISVIFEKKATIELLKKTINNPKYVDSLLEKKRISIYK